MYAPIDEIAAIVERYRRLPADFSDIMALTYGKDLIATHLFSLAIHLSDVIRRHEEAEFKRKAAYFRKYEEWTRDGKTSVSAAEKLAELSVLDLRSVESGLKAEKDAMRLLYEAGENVMNAIGQRVSTLKAEKGFEMKGNSTAA